MRVGLKGTELVFGGEAGYSPSAATSPIEAPPVADARTTPSRRTLTVTGRWAVFAASSEKCLRPVRSRGSGGLNRLLPSLHFGPPRGTLLRSQSSPWKNHSTCVHASVSPALPAQEQRRRDSPGGSQAHYSVGVSGSVNSITRTTSDHRGAVRGRRLDFSSLAS